VGGAGRIADQVACLNLENLTISGHFSSSGQYQVELFLGTAVGMQPDTGTGWKFRQVDEVTAPSQGISVSNASEPDEPFTVVSSNSGELKTVEIIPIEESIPIHEGPQNSPMLWTRVSPWRQVDVKRSLQH
jgi:hypothetical protein